MSEVAVITVDGPGGTGKGTVCSYLANWLNWHLLDSGALYRLLALAAEKQKIAMDDAILLSELVEKLDIAFIAGSAGTLMQTKLDGEDVTVAVRTESCGNNASKVAALMPVRQALLERQHAFRQPPGLIADGRDMGTVVFRDAILKLFLTASADIRAERRYKQLLDSGIGANLRDLYAEIKLRDARDSERSVSPLKPAEDAIVIDTGDVDIDGVVDVIRQHVDKRIPEIHQ